LVYEYEIKNLKIMHYDLFRLKTPKETKQLGIFEENEDSIKIIEWPKLLENIIQKKDRLEINFKYTESDNERNINLLGFGKWKDFKINGI